MNAMTRNSSAHASSVSSDCKEYACFISWVINKLRGRKIPFHVNDILPQGNVVKKGEKGVQRKQVFLCTMEQMIEVTCSGSILGTVELIFGTGWYFKRTQDRHSG